MGMDPGLTDVFARYAADQLFDEIDEVHVRDGGDLRIEGYAFAPVFSIWTTIEECLNPPLIWERGARLLHVTEPFSAPESFVFPEGIGPVECVNVEHEEVVLVPRGVDCGKVTFKYALGTEFIDVLQHAPQARARLDEAGPRQGRRGGAARRGRGAHPGSGARRRPDEGPGDRRHVGDRPEGRRSLARSTSTRRPSPRRLLARLRAAGRRLADRVQPGRRRWSCWRTAPGRDAACSVPEQFDARPYLDVLDRWGIHWAMEERVPGRIEPT